LGQIHGLLEQQARKERQKPKWTKELKWMWAKDRELVKPFGVPFGLNLNTKQVDFFKLKNYKRNLSIGAFSTCFLLVGLWSSTLCWYPHYGFSLMFGKV
jgi:hypothetical protein